MFFRFIIFFNFFITSLTFSRILFPGMFSSNRHWLRWCRSRVEEAYRVAKGFLVLIWMGGKYKLVFWTQLHGKCRHLVINFTWNEFVVPLWSKSWLRQATIRPRTSI